MEWEWEWSLRTCAYRVIVSWWWGAWRRSIFWLWLLKQNIHSNLAVVGADSPKVVGIATSRRLRSEMKESQKVDGTRKASRRGCCLLLAPAAGPDLVQWPKVRCQLRLARPARG